MSHERRPPRVATHFPSLAARQPNANVYMFVEDVKLSIMPLKAIRGSEAFSVEMSGRDDHVESATSMLRSLARHECYRLEDLVSETVRSIALRLAWRGSAVHEIISVNEPIPGYVLHAFTTERLVRCFGLYIQFIPKSDRNLWKRRYVVLRDRDVWEVRVPDSLGGASGYHAILKQLARFDHLHPQFWREELAKGDMPRYFDLQRYVRETEIYYGRVTAKWGWDRRDHSDRNATEFYRFYRMLKFKWAQAVLREHILAELNELFSRLNLEVTLAIRGLISPQEIEAIRSRMLNGDVSFAEAYDACCV